VEMLIPSTLDPSLAPEGRHVASLFVQHVAPHLPGNRSWQDEREKEAFADLVIGTVSCHAPNFKASVIARQALSPLDLERRFGMTDGDIFHGDRIVSGSSTLFQILQNSSKLTERPNFSQICRCQS
jgi:phytoene dehydrogenase-like protein